MVAEGVRSDTAVSQFSRHAQVLLQGEYRAYVHLLVRCIALICQHLCVGVSAQFANQILDIENLVAAGAISSPLIFS